MDPRFRDECGRLLSRYLELARRRSMTIHPAENCVPVLHELAKELRLNCIAFKLSPDKLVTTNLLSEQPLRELSQDATLAPFPGRFRGLVERAVASNPADRHGYLRDLHFRFPTCAAHENQHERAPLTGKTLLFLAKTLRHLDPLSRLALFRAELKSLLQTKEFQPLLGIFVTDSARGNTFRTVPPGSKSQGVSRKDVGARGSPRTAGRAMWRATDCQGQYGSCASERHARASQVESELLQRNVGNEGQLR
jgi:hypothetical protein